jgi:hypothetical protein
MYKKVSYNNNESSSRMVDAFITTRAGLCRWFCLAIACLCCLFPLQLRADNFIITHAQTGPHESTVVLDAGLRIDFADEVLEALRNGVPITVMLTMEVEKLRDYVWNKNIASLQQRYTLQYHALSEQYIVRNLNSEEQNNFRSLNSALNALGEVKALPVIDRQLLDGEDDYQLRLRAEIDINALPSPLRPVAWLSSAWRQGSDWYICELKF